MTDKLPWMCSIPDCERKRTGTLDICETHRAAQAKKERKATEPKKERAYLQRGGPPKKVSDKRAAQLKDYNSQVEEWKKDKTCLMCDWEGLKKPCEHAHHSAGREGDRLLDFTKLVPLCAKHHIWATEHSKEAIELGISLPRNQTV